MVAPISSLANMEMQLYGGFGTNFNAPSYLNNYAGANFNNNAYANPAFYGYNAGYGQAFGQNIPSNYMQGTQTTQSGQASVFEGLTKKESDALVNYYAKGLTPTQSLVAAGVSGATTMAIFANPRLVAHPLNSVSTLKGVEGMFKGIKDTSSALGKLWQNPDTNEMLREAYSQAHKAKARLETHWGGLFKQSFQDNPENKKIVEGLLKEMDDALKVGNKEKIAEVTAKLQQTEVKDGLFKRGWLAVKNFVTGGNQQVSTVKESIEKSANDIATSKAKLLANNPTTFLERMKAPGTVNNALVMAAFTLVFSIGKIKSAFVKDKENQQKGISSNEGIKQIGQSTVKALANAAGWTVGQAAGTALFAKVGAKIGTMFGPGVGTIIGGVIGLVGGSVGMAIADKISNKVVGEDVANKIEAENKSKTQQGQTELLQYTVQQAQAGKALPADVQQALSKLMLQQSA